MGALMIIKWIESLFTAAAPIAEKIASDVAASGGDASAHQAFAAHLKEGAAKAAAAAAAHPADDASSN